MFDIEARNDVVICHIKTTMIFPNTLYPTLKHLSQIKHYSKPHSQSWLLKQSVNQFFFSLFWVNEEEEKEEQDGDEEDDDDDDGDDDDDDDGDDDLDK